MSCIVKKCINRKKNTVKGISFHRLPLDETRRILWLDALGLHRNELANNKEHLVCSDHFSDKFYFTNSRRLLSNGVPSIKLGNDLQADTTRDTMLIKIDKNICRICLKNLDANDGINIFTDNAILQKFEQITQLKIELNDGLTETFCHDCLNKLHIASKFIELSKSSDLYMRKYVENLNNHFNFVAKKPIHCQFYEEEELNLLINEGFEVESTSINNNTNMPQAANKTFQKKFEEFNKPLEKSPVETLTEILQTETSQCEEEDSHSLSSLDTFLQLPPAKKKKLEKNYNQNKSLDVMPLINLTLDKLTNIENNFECGICGRHYTKELYLKKHMKLHDKDKDLFCKICKQYFINDEMIRKHFAECDHNYPFQCEICFEKFSQRRLLSLHAQKHLNEKLFQCNDCDMKFNIMDQLKAHSKLTHKMPKVIVKGSQSNFWTNLPAENIYECLKCEMKYPRDDLLQKHIQNFHETITCHICADQVIEKLFNQHLEDHEKLNAIFKCGQCEDQFNEKEELEKHFKLHANSFECDFCDKSFEKAMYLNKHLLLRHQIQVSEAEIIELWICEICNLSLVSKIALLDHQKSRHGSKLTNL